MYQNYRLGLKDHGKNDVSIKSIASYIFGVTASQVPAAKTINRERWDQNYKFKIV